MAYGDHVKIRTSPSEKPTCWGNPNTYDPNDFECQGCMHQHSCRSYSDRGERPTAVRPAVSNSNPYRRTYRRGDDDGVSSNYESGIVEEGEKPVERFAKDCAAGALRGLFYEAWQFFRNFRFR